MAGESAWRRELFLPPRATFSLRQRSFSLRQRVFSLRQRIFSLRQRITSLRSVKCNETVTEAAIVAAPRPYRG